MHHNVLICIGLNLVVNIISSNALGISSKLDLDGLDSSPKLVGTQHKQKPLFHRQIRIENAKPADNLENIGVVCISGKGCNTTQSNQSGDSIQTDVIVHVKTTVESNKNNKSKTVEENPDVPIIIGTGDNNLRDEQNVISNSRNLVVTASNDNFFPAVNSIVSPLPTTPSLYGNLYPQKYNFLPSEPGVNLNIEPLPSVALTRNNDFKYKTGLQIPRFEPSYHRHYFEENPPQQVVWYSKPTGYDPKATLKPSAWSPGIIQSTTHRHHAGPGGVCSCKNEVSRGLQWYPTRPLYRADAGSEINDKLAPLA